LFLICLATCALEQLSSFGALAVIKSAGTFTFASFSRMQSVCYSLNEF
jgi:hypothetical protein